LRIEVFLAWGRDVPVAAAFAFLGAADEAFEWLEHAVAAGFVHYPMLAEHDPFLASVRGDARFLKLLARVKEEWEQFEV
jgi:hypothetical protein